MNSWKKITFYVVNWSVERRTATCSIPEDLVGVLRDSNGRQLTTNPPQGTFRLECLNVAGKLKESKTVQCINGEFSEQLRCSG